MKMYITFGFVLLCAGLVFAQTTATFENLSLAPDSYWDGQDNWDGEYPTAYGEKIYNDTFASGGVSFNNQFIAGWYDGGTWGDYGMTSWSGFAYSNRTDTTTPGFSNQYSVCTGAAAGGENFAVAYCNSLVTPTLTLGQPAIVSGLQMTNVTYTYLSLRDGDMFAEPLAAGDWFKVTVTGKSAGGATTGSLDVYLGDYRDGKTILVDSWIDVDLTGLGTVASLEFSMSAWNASLNGGAGGTDYYWPAYAAIDNVVVAPEPATMLLLAAGGVALLRRRRK